MCLSYFFIFSNTPNSTETMKALSNNGLVVHLHGAKIPSLFIKDFKCNSDVSFDPDYILTLIMSNG